MRRSKNIKVDNVMHAPKFRRMGEQHINKAKLLHSKIKYEPIRIKREPNSNSNDGKGIKHIS